MSCIGLVFLNIIFLAETNKIKLPEQGFRQRGDGGISPPSNDSKGGYPSSTYLVFLEIFFLVLKI
jgi:hypothetical protein